MMAYVLVENNTVIQKSFRARPGFIEVDDSVVCGQIDKGGGVFENPPPTPEAIAAAAQETQNRLDIQVLASDAKFNNLIKKTPAQAKNWVQTSFPTLTTPEQNDLATIVQAIGILGRRL